MVMSSTSSRLETFLEMRGLRCKCERCMDPTELGLHTGTLRCSQCKDWMLPADTAKIEESAWRCIGSCGRALAAKEAKELAEARLREALSTGDPPPHDPKDAFTYASIEQVKLERWKYSSVSVIRLSVVSFVCTSNWCSRIQNTLLGAKRKIIWGSCHKRQKPQAPIRNPKTRKVANAKVRYRYTNVT